MFTDTRIVRIEWGDCDPAGIIYYPRYFDIVDNATALLFERVLGLTKAQMLKAYDFAGFPLVNTRARFLRPTTFGDDATVATTITFGKSSFDTAHRISVKDDLCVECWQTRVWVAQDASGQIKSHPIPEALIARFRR
jgi:4-hydroxybenzoyl-CoA thioesterase